MKIRHLFIWLVALSAMTFAFTSCSSDSELDVIETQVPSELAGTWDFQDFTITIDQQTYGIVEYDKDGSFKVSTRSASVVIPKVFTYTYNLTKRRLIGTCTDGKMFTLSDIHIDSDGKLVVTYGESGEEKTQSGTKHVYTAISQGQFMGRWYLEGNEYFYFTATGVVLNGNDQTSGTWRTDGYSVWITIDGKETEYIRNIIMQGNVMKAHVYDGSKYYQLLTFKQNDNGGNADGGGGDSSETIDDGGKTDKTKPNTDGGSYWGE